MDPLEYTPGEYTAEETGGIPYRRYQYTKIKDGIPRRAYLDDIAKQLGIPADYIYQNTRRASTNPTDLSPTYNPEDMRVWLADAPPPAYYQIAPNDAYVDEALAMSKVIGEPLEQARKNSKFSDVVNQALADYVTRLDAEPQSRSVGSPAAPRDRSGSGERIRRGQAAMAAAKPMTEQDYYDEEAERVAASARAYEARAAAKPMTEQDYYDEEAEQVAEDARAYEARQGARAGAEPARRDDRSGSGARIAAGQANRPYDRSGSGERVANKPYDRSGSGERVADGQQEQWVNTLKADFEVTHGTPYDPNSTMDQAKMGVLADARRMYPDATPTQLALKIYRGEFD